MASIFEAIQGKTYNRPRETLLVSHTKVPENKQDIVSVWQKDKSTQNTRKVLQMLKPTIQSALHTYTPGQQDNFRLKATSLALQSLSGYNPQKATSPSTYVFTNLQRLNRLRRQRQTPVHIPESQVYALQLIQKKQQQLEDRLGREPSLQQLSDYTGLSPKKIEKVRSGSAYTSQSSTTDETTGVDLIGAKDTSDKDYYDYVYSSVSPLDQKIMEWTSGYNGKALSNNQIASKLHLSAGAVSQRKARIQQLLGQVRGLV